MGRFEDIWKHQKIFNDNFVKSDLTQEEKEIWTKDYCLWLSSEIHELLGEINYKGHRKYHSLITPSNLIEEWIDIFKYWLSIGLIWGWDVDEFIDEYYRKSSVVEQRFQQEIHARIKPSDKIVMLDLDGVLADYPNSFQNFVKDKTGIWIELQGYDLFYEYGEVIGRDKIRELKHEYRETGQKLNIPLCDGAVELCNGLHDKKYRIIFLTSRPIKQYSRIFADTLAWLDKNGLKKTGDVVIFDEEKDYKVLKEFPKLKFMVEDNPKFAMNIAKLGYKVYLIDKKYNQNCEHENVIRINHLKEIKI